VTAAWADHGAAGLRTAGPDPLLQALLWAGLALVMGVAVVIVVGRLARRRQSPE